MGKRANAKKWLEKEYERDLQRHEEIFRNRPSIWERVEARINDVYSFFLMRAVNDSATLSGDQQAVVSKLASEIFLDEEPFRLDLVLGLATYINSCHE